MKRLVKYVLLITFIGVLGVIVGALFQGVSPYDLYRVSKTVIRERIDCKTVEERIADIEKLRPELIDVAVGTKMAILVFKQERRVEMFADAWNSPKIYQMKGFSGELGPKLTEGDGQIPEGVYGIEYMNPNSMFYLSLKVDYPNEFDRVKAAVDGRTKLGGDIMIHGGTASSGCVPVGDEGIEEMFYFVGKIGYENVTVVISPYDMRRGRRADLEVSNVPWYQECCNIIDKELAKIHMQPKSLKR